jgi:hypothetical protein
VNDAQLVRGVEAARRLLEDGGCLSEREHAACFERFEEGLALQILHGDVESTIVRLAGFVDGDDVGVPDATCHRRLG